MKSVVLVPLILSCFCIPVTDEKSQITVYTVLNALDKVLQYYRAEYKNMNLDGTYGLRVVEGHSALLVEEHNTGLHQMVPVDVFDTLERLRQEARTIANMALPHMQEKDPGYFKRLTPLIREPWRVSHPHRKTDITSVVHGNINQDLADQDDIAMDEEMSDACMSQMMGTNNRDPACTVSAECWSLMTRPKQSLYAITHQVLYFAVAEQVECTDTVNEVAKQYGKGSIRQIQHELCSAMIEETKKIVWIGIPIYEEDLLMEQVFTCGSLGYVDFIRLDWLERMLSWQHSGGCYGYRSRKRQKPVSRERDARAVGDEHEHGRVAGEERERLRDVKDIENQPHKSRKLQRVQDLKDGCEAHKTAVAAGALIVHVRFFIDPGPPGVQAMLQAQEEHIHTHVPVYDIHLQIPIEESESMHRILPAFIILAVVLTLFLLTKLFKQRKITVRL